MQTAKIVISVEVTRA